LNLFWYFEILNTSSMVERLTRVPRVRKVWSLNPGPAKSYTGCKRFATASISMQETVLP